MSSACSNDKTQIPLESPALTYPHNLKLDELFEHF